MMRSVAVLVVVLAVLRGTGCNCKSPVDGPHGGAVDSGKEHGEVATVTVTAAAAVSSDRERRDGLYSVMVDNPYSWQWDAELERRRRERRRSEEAEFYGSGGESNGRLRWRGGEDGHHSAITRRGLQDMSVNEEEQQQQVPAAEVEDVAAQRDYLNGLVQASVDKTREQACNIAFAKTHKTASTTLAMIFVRYARRHDKKLAYFTGNHVSAIPLWAAVQQVEKSGERLDVMHYHYTESGEFKGRWDVAMAAYTKIMQEDERVSYISVLRDQRTHFLSYYYYFVQPDIQLSVQHFFDEQGEKYHWQRQRLYNPMCFEFGIRSEEQLNDFIEHHLPEFRLILLTEQFDEGLMVLRRLMGWDMIDVTYSPMMQTKGGTHRWDGKELKDVPHFDVLPSSVQDKIDASTKLDKRLYEAAETHYLERKAIFANEIEAELEEFEELQGVMKDYLARNHSSGARKWYAGTADPYRGGPPFYAF